MGKQQPLTACGRGCPTAWTYIAKVAAMATCVGALIIAGDAVLLGLRAPHMTYPGCWDLIGGHVEADETPVSALGRELHEEIGISLTAWAFVEGIRFVEDGNYSELLVFEIKEWRGEIILTNDEHVDLRWHHLSDAAELEYLALPEYRPLFRRMLAAV